MPLWIVKEIYNFGSGKLGLIFMLSQYFVYYVIKKGICHECEEIVMTNNLFYDISSDYLETLLYNSL